MLIFGPIALLFAPSPFYPLHATQARPQKTLQIYVLLLQVASLEHFNDVSDIILMPPSCIRPHIGSILMYPTLFWLHFSHSGHFFLDFSRNVLPASIGSTILNIDTSIFNEKSYFFDVEMSQIEPITMIIFGPAALLFALFPSYPLHASQARHRKTLQICVLLVQVASLGDFNDVSDIILMPSSCIRSHFGSLLMYLTLFWLPFSLSGHSCL